MTRLGFLGVPAFFIISGYMIFESSRKRSAEEFFVFRFSRLFPAYLFSIAMTLSVSAYGFRLKSNYLTTLVATLTLSQSPLHLISLQGSYWTLWVEIRFYLLFLIFGIYLSRKRSYDRRVLIFSALWLFASILYYPNYVNHSTIPETNLISLVMPNFASFFLLGCFSAMAREKDKRVAVSPFLFMSLVLSFLQIENWIKSWDLHWKEDLYLGLSIFFLIAIMVLVRLDISVSKEKVQNLFGLIGKSSYCFYLLQEGFSMPLISFAVNRLGWHLGESFFAALLITISISIIFVYFVEDPISRRLRIVFSRSLSSFSSSAFG